MYEHWISTAIKRPGALHRALDVPEGQKKPENKIEKAAHSSNERLAREGRLAETLEHLRKN